MLKMLLFLLGLAFGAAGGAAWLLSEPEASAGAPAPAGPHAVSTRWSDLQTEVKAALAEGQRAKRETEERLRRELAAYRRGQESAAS